jgi:hypothetical protein
LVKFHFDTKRLSYYTFYPKPEKPIKAVISHLPHDTPAEDISDGLVNLGFEVVTVKQMTNTSRSPPEKSNVINLPLFLVTLPGTSKSQVNFLLPRLCYIPIRVEAYRDHNSVTQCHNCQKFAHV